MILLRRLLEHFGIDRGVDLDRRVFYCARILAVLFILVQIGKSQTVRCSPIAKLSLALKWTGLSHSLIRLPQNSSSLGVYVPTDPGNRAANIHDRSLDVADLFRACGRECNRRIVHMLREINRVMMNLG